MNTLKRLSLGQTAAIGTLYDARTETFLDQSLLTGEIPADAIASSTVNRDEITLLQTGAVKERFEALDVSPELGASLLAGLVPPRGSARYLSQQGDSVPTVQRAAILSVTTKIEQLSFMGGNTRELLNFNVLKDSTATHVLTGITWGGRAIVSMQKRITLEADKQKCSKQLDQALEPFSKPQGNNHSWLDLPSDEQTNEEPQVRLYTDAREVLDGQADNVADALEHFNHFSPHVQATGGKPLIYTLLPIAFLVTLGAIVPNHVTAGQLSAESYEQTIELVDTLAEVQQTLNAHRQLLQQHRTLVNDAHLDQVEKQISKVRAAETQLRAGYTEGLTAVRQNRASSQGVLDLISTVKTDVAAARDLMNVAKRYEDKVAFLVRMIGLGASYAENARTSPQELIERASTYYNTFYVFHFNSRAMDTSELWRENSKLLEELLTQDQKPEVQLIDWDNYGAELPQPCIGLYANGMVVIENVFEQKKEIASKHLVRYDRSFLESTNDVPTYRKSLRIPCPGPFCEEQDLCLWSCGDCHETIEFGSRDGYFYCDCGRVPFDRAEFNCQRPRHKDGYFQFDRNDLRDLLRSLPEPREVNILILGETGVGKSTFVNAFVNYLTFSSLDEGLKDPKLNCIIPCSFTTQVVDQHGRMISKDVVVGRDKDEVDGSKGDSATQKATVYPLYFRDTLIRLIDTPGIGDTRGLEQDKQNMANMLAILRNYPALHGILILLKPNNARLGVMFRFCVKELLTHLHTSAAQNMVFGFTNTRGSNYTPGDTFKPLESLLSEYHNVIPQLSRSNVYCFDSESFRYLAARKQGIEMGHMDDYRRSWEQSSQEADRLLAHFQSLRPHHTQETLSLNETRHLIAQLTAPMQQISVAITDTIAKNKQQADDLYNAQLTRDDLKTKLRIHKTTVSAEQLTKPKTVCANEACIESVFDASSNSEVLLRKKLCHNPCCLTNVPVGKVGTPQLKNCFAFAGDNCTICSHSWKEHEHILVEYAKRQETVVDANVQRELTTTGSMIKAKENAIKAIEKNIAELKEEHKQVQTAAAKFSLYLKHNSITHYNDATVEYLEHLIRDERTKVRTGQSRARLESLEKDLDDYQKFVEAMEQKDKDSVVDGADAYAPLNEAGVAKLVQKLYNLPHYGQMLKDLAQVVANAYEANFRERPYRISRRSAWRDYLEGQGQRGRNGGSVFGRKKSVRNPFMAPPTTSRTFSPNEPNGPSSGWSEKLMGPAPRQREESEFWPQSEKRGASSAGPVRSIMDWDNAAPSSRTGPSGATYHGAPNSFDGSGPFSAPPPYPGPGGDAQINGGQQEIVERKGVWVRLKDKLRKK
ncbi:hypothetical protein BJX68DRAFT_275519 [Aspergillus pseudodeflectus]|uniref:G domain-containing protein n=1 Tax=Aspergillus pseudodeflectus TaxID=176178 RepID=A0ABR4L6D3_9EURO